VTACAMPGCPGPGDHLNRREQRVCIEHVAVVVGNDVADRHTSSEAADS
jgi:hypothetical protein